MCCWFVIVPGQVTRSEGEKVRAGDDVLLRSFSFDRYLCADVDLNKEVVSPFTSPDIPGLFNFQQLSQTSTVIASFNKTLWGLQLFTSITAKEQEVGLLLLLLLLLVFCCFTVVYILNVALFRVFMRTRICTVLL